MKIELKLSVDQSITIDKLEQEEATNGLGALAKFFRSDSPMTLGYHRSTLVSLSGFEPEMYTFKQAKLSERPLQVAQAELNTASPSSQAKNKPGWKTAHVTKCNVIAAAHRAPRSTACTSPMRADNKL